MNYINRGFVILGVGLIAAAFESIRPIGCFVLGVGLSMVSRAEE